MSVLNEEWVGSASASGAVTVFLVLAGASVAVLLLVAVRELRRKRCGDLHAHHDGTVHEHFRGSRPHVHPTLLERYALLDRTLGGGPPGSADGRPRDL